MRKRYRRLPPKQSTGNDMFFKPTVQRKLKVGKAGDAFEVEADAVADKVVNSTDASQMVQKTAGTEEEVQQKSLADSVIQKETLKEDEPVQKMEEEEPVQQMEEEEAVQTKEEPIQQMKEEESVQNMEDEESVQQLEEEETVQTKPTTNSGANPSLGSRLKQSKGTGNKMDAKTRREMETRFGANFGSIRIHTDANAIQMSKELGAQAFTHGKDIYFNEGKYNPNSKEGQHLLAHELTHTIQQNGDQIKSMDQEPEVPME